MNVRHVYLPEFAPVQLQLWRQGRSLSMYFGIKQTNKKFHILNGKIGIQYYQSEMGMCICQQGRTIYLFRLFTYLGLPKSANPSKPDNKWDKNNPITI